MENEKRKQITYAVLALVILCAALAFGLGQMEDSSEEIPEAQPLEATFTEDAEGDGAEVMDSEIPEAYTMESFPIILQIPELPTGCEVTALTMVLQYYGFDVEKTTMAAEYLPTVDEMFYYGEDGTLYGTDLQQYFIGNPFTEDGVVCGTGAIVTAADTYLNDQGSDMQAIDLTGSSPEELYGLVSQDIPVIVWVTIGMADREVNGSWYTEDGTYIDWSTSDHGAVLIGYSEDLVTIADPISGETEYDREQFESVFESRSCQCVILE